MEIYMGLLLGVILLTPIFKGTKKESKVYIVIVGALLFYVCAMRGVRIGADLGRYESHYEACFNAKWGEIFEIYQWENIGFYYLLKIHSTIFGFDFHSLLFILAAIQALILVYFVMKRSVNPYQSFLMYLALGYYVFTFSGLKQALATAVLMLTFDAIVEKKMIRFYILCVLAAFIHLPSLIFIPAYFIANRRLNVITIFSYIILAGVVFIFRDNLALSLADMYDTVVSTSVLGGVGGKALMMLVFVIAGYLLRRPNGENRVYSASFNLMIAATILQTFAVYGNVFERLADYYFIFAIIYIPLMFERCDLREGSEFGLIVYDRRLYDLANIVILVFSVVYYYFTVSGTYGLIPYVFN